jgi:hypothetical protein
MDYTHLHLRWSALVWMLWCIVGCTAPSYLPVPVADPGEQKYRGLSPSAPEQAIVRAQHLGQLQADTRYLEEVLVRAEQNRLHACRTPDATQMNSIAYQQCQFKDQIYEQLRVQAAMAKNRYLRAVSGHGGTNR